jgi:hypothetical protein
MFSSLASIFMLNPASILATGLPFLKIIITGTDLILFFKSSPCSSTNAFETLALLIDLSFE